MSKLEGAWSAYARRSRVAISALFFLLGVGFASWAVRIPDVQHHFGLSSAGLGAALLAMAVGSLLGAPTARAVASRVDAARVARGCALTFIVAVALPPLAPGYEGLCGVLLLLGAASGALGVAMNAQAVLLERQLGRPLMSSFHGVFSLGALGGALSGGAVAGADIPAAVHLPVVAGLLLALASLAASHLLHAPAQGTPAIGRPRRSVLAFGWLAFGVLFCEGAVADWSAVFLREEADAGPGLSAVGYAVFAAAMAAGRLSGDRLALAWGPSRLVTAAGVCATAGGGAILVPNTAIAVIGFALLGAGLSVVFPNALAAAARQTREHPEGAIAAVSTVGFAGFLLGPPVIGLLAETAGLRTALLTLPVCTTIIILLGRTLDRGQAGECRGPKLLELDPA